MNLPKLTAFLWLLLLSASILAQKRIVIEQKDLTAGVINLSRFEDNSKISRKALDSGVIVQLATEAGVVAGKLDAAKPDSVVGAYGYYSLSNVGTQSGGAVDLQILGADGKRYTLKINLSPDDDVPKPPNVVHDPCDGLSVKTKFGEDPSTYTDRTVVYVYNFSENLARRRFYKITKRKKSNTLQVQRVNMNTELLCPGSDAYLKLVNINKFMYDITLSDTLVNFDSEPSELFTRLFLGDSTILGSLLNTFTSNESVPANANGLDVAHEPNQAPNAQPCDNQNIACLIKGYLTMCSQLHAKMLRAYNPCSAFPCCDEQITADYVALADKLLDIRLAAAALQQSDNNAKKDLAVAKNKQAAFQSQDSLTKVIAQKQPTDVQQNQLDALKKTINGDNAANVQAKIKSLNETIAANSGLADLVTNLPTDADLRKIIVFLNNMVQRNDQELYPLPTDGNRLDLTLNIRSKDSIFKYFSLPQYNNPPIHYGIPIVKRAFVSFSSGTFIGFGNGLTTKTYTWQQIPDNTNTIQDTGNYLLVANGWTMPPIGFSALGNVEWKMARAFGIGVSVGVGLTLEASPRAAYLAGGSLFFGDLRQFALTVGVVGIGVDQLTNQWQTVADKNIIYTTKPDINYYSELKLGGFLTLTYTPFTTTKH